MIFKRNNKKPKQSCLSTLFQAFIIFVTSTTLFFMSINVKPTRVYTRLKSCLLNIRVLTKVIEQYNHDNTIKITELNDAAFETLKKEGYLKRKPEPPEASKCEYFSDGDLTNKGYVYCKYHGDLDRIRNCEFKEEYDEDEYYHSRFLYTLKSLAICVGPSIIYILVNIF